MQTVVNGLRQLAPRFGQEDTTAAPLEQRHTQIVLEQTHRATDGAVRQMQFVGRPAEMLMARRGLETKQRHQRRQTVTHFM